MTQTNLPQLGRNEIEVVVALSVVFWFEFKKKKQQQQNEIVSILLPRHT